jgi:hypothetical protein
MKTVIEMAEDVGAGIADLPMEDAVLFEVDILSGRSAKLEAFAELVRADEREACAKVCEAWKEWGADGALLAKAIRARGNT